MHSITLFLGFWTNFTKFLEKPRLPINAKNKLFLGVLSCLPLVSCCLESNMYNWSIFLIWTPIQQTHWDNPKFNVFSFLYLLQANILTDIYKYWSSIIAQLSFQIPWVPTKLWPFVLEISSSNSLDRSSALLIPRPSFWNLNQGMNNSLVEIFSIIVMPSTFQNMLPIFMGTTSTKVKHS